MPGYGGKGVRDYDPGGSLGRWKKRLKAGAEAWWEAAGKPPIIDEPVAVALWFYLPRVGKTVRKSPCKGGDGDIDTMVRPVFDSLKKIVWFDDSRPITLFVAQRYRDTTGVFIQIAPDDSE